MPRYTVVYDATDHNDNEHLNRTLPVEAPDRETANETAQSQLGQKYQFVRVKEVRGNEVNPILACKAALKADPDVKRPETFAALRGYFKATGQDWLIPHLSG